MGFWQSGVHHLVCLMLKNLTITVYETVILKFFKAPGFLLTSYGTTNIRCVFYPLVSLVTSGCWMSDEGRDTVAVRLQGLFAQHGESCLLQGIWTVLLTVSLCWMTDATYRPCFICLFCNTASSTEAIPWVPVERLMCEGQESGLKWLCRGIGNCFTPGQCVNISEWLLVGDTCVKTGIVSL